jgi:hypothetical protein
MHPPRPVRLPARAAAAIALGLLLFCARPAAGTPGEIQQLCDRAAELAAAETGVPVTILRALTRAETGRTRDGAFGPWPWTVNNAGDGRWFDDLHGALRHAESRRSAGARNLDIGCFQINLRWHGHAFTSLREMFDPLENARYAATFLTGLHREFGTWDAAVAAYHSRTPRYAARYMVRFHRLHAAQSADPAPPQDSRGAIAPPRALDMSRRPAIAASLAGPGAAGFLETRAARPLWEN